MMATHKQRTITLAVLTHLEEETQALYDRAMREILHARQQIGGDAPARRAQLDYSERCLWYEHVGEMGVINRLRAMLLDSESGAA